MTKGLVDIHGDGETNTKCFIKGLTQVAAQGRPKGLHESRGTSSYINNNSWQACSMNRCTTSLRQEIMRSCLTTHERMCGGEEWR